MMQCPEIPLLSEWVVPRSSGTWKCLVESARMPGGVGSRGLGWSGIDIIARKAQPDRRRINSIVELSKEQRAKSRKQCLGHTRYQLYTNTGIMTSNPPRLSQRINWSIVSSQDLFLTFSTLWSQRNPQTLSKCVLRISYYGENKGGSPLVLSAYKT